MGDVSGFATLLPCAACACRDGSQTFGDADDTRSVYHYTVQPLVALMFKRGGRGTCFAYGQTGSVSWPSGQLPA